MYCSENCKCQNCLNVPSGDKRNPGGFSLQKHRLNLQRNFHQKRNKVIFCNCSRSNCQKNYCPCFKAKQKCGVYCKCTECFNHPGHKDRPLKFKRSTILRTPTNPLKRKAEVDITLEKEVNLINTAKPWQLKSDSTLKKMENEYFKRIQINPMISNKITMQL